MRKHPHRYAITQLVASTAGGRGLVLPVQEVAVHQADALAIYFDAQVFFAEAIEVGDIADHFVALVYGNGGINC